MVDDSLYGDNIGNRWLKAFDDYRRGQDTLPLKPPLVRAYSFLVIAALASVTGTPLGVLNRMGYPVPTWSWALTVGLAVALLLIAPSTILVALRASWPYLMLLLYLLIVSITTQFNGRNGYLVLTVLATVVIGSALGHLGRVRSSTILVWFAVVVGIGVVAGAIFYRNLATTSLLRRSTIPGVPWLGEGDLGGLASNATVVQWLLAAALIANLCTRSSKKDFLGSTLFLAAALLLAGGTTSKVALTVAVALLILVGRSKLSLRQFAGMLFVVCIMGGSLLVSQLTAGGLAGRDPSLTGRLPVWIALMDEAPGALPANASGLQLGFGSEQVESLRQEVGWQPKDAHNTYLQAYINGGLPALVALITVFGVLVVRAARSRGSPLLTVGVVTYMLIRLVTCSDLLKPSIAVVLLAWISAIAYADCESQRLIPRQQRA